MKAISVRQPWAWAILHLPDAVRKDIENRGGPVWSRARVPPVLALHAAKGCARDEYAVAADCIEEVADIRPPPLAELDRGCLVGLMRMQSTPVFASESPWYAGEVGLVILDRRALVPVPMKGMLGLFDVPGKSLPDAARDTWRRAYEEMRGPNQWPPP